MSNQADDIRIRVLDLTQLILWVNAALDTGEYGDITVEEVSKHVDRGDVIPYLRDRLADAGVIRPSFSQEAVAEITAAMQSLHDAYGGSRDWGVNNNGLHAVVAWANEMIQQGAADRTISLPWSRR